MNDAFSLPEFNNRLRILFILFLLLFSIDCKKEKPLFFDFPVNSLKGVVAKYNLNLDNEVSYDGLGSIKVDSKDTTTAYLFVIRNIPVKRAKLIWEAYCKSKDLKGKALFEMGIKTLRKYSRDTETFLHRSKDYISGTTDWQKIRVEFLLLDYIKVNVVQLNLIVEGKGTVWIDQVKFSTIPI